ncbi:hypothetical protein [Pseudacidobacterium ailaaui]|jgi:hypothetical protein|uniref:hypothetical protein n=1 Tax=Pseudacidobacterium ailaaui TaxID=1382359 RepID=UPI00047DC425|nr:hypothetical protein [Pseudacidobacterium ailaaui]MBX6358518.1 hypothetical protein [Pseudacidobacterium ailaaui]MCL6463737.1 hypothetical protein [Pseudacidobacterium ailaaui]MDI3254207.1 hypothetical protein [Bacillota bacterium]
MADQLYLSLWYPNFRLTSLGPALLGVMRQFNLAGGDRMVRSASAYPISWNEAPQYQRIYDEEDGEAAAPEQAVPAALELLHDDFAYEFEMTWELWTPETGGGLDPIWRKEPRVVRIAGFGPEFDEGAYEQNGQIRVDFGLDTAFLYEDLDLDPEAAERVKENVQMLVDFTNGVQQHCGISSRLLWSESGESLAQKLIARLQQVN